MKAGLTPKQKECFDFICAYFAKNLYAPSYDEIMGHMDLRSKSGIHRLIKGITERGLIKHMPNRARAIVPCHMEHLLGPASDWLNISIDPDLFPAVREAAGQSGVPAQELVNRVLREALS